MSVTGESPANAAAAGGGGSGGGAAAADAAAADAAAAAAAAARSGGQASTSSSVAALAGITFRQYRDERDLPAVVALVDADLSEPYSVFTYRYFLAQWPHLCFLAFDGGNGSGGGEVAGSSSSSSEGGGEGSGGGAPVGAVICKVEDHRGKALRGYVAMLVVDKARRGRGIARALVSMAITAMAAIGADEVALEAEATNHGALALYRSLGFVRDKHLHRYYLNNADAYRLKLLLPHHGSNGSGGGEAEDEGRPLDVLADAAAAAPGLIA